MASLYDPFYVTLGVCTLRCIFISERKLCCGRTFSVEFWFEPSLTPWICDTTSLWSISVPSTGLLYGAEDTTPELSDCCCSSPRPIGLAVKLRSWLDTWLPPIRVLKLNPEPREEPLSAAEVPSLMPASEQTRLPLVWQLLPFLLALPECETAALPEASLVCKLYTVSSVEAKFSLTRRISLFRLVTPRDFSDSILSAQSLMSVTALLTTSESVLMLVC